MADYQQQDLTEVESLLASRQRIAEWLKKLEEAGSRTPPSVRERVRADYQGRLTQVVDQLRSHSDVISNALAGLRAQAEEFEELRSEEQETLAEAELRHAVGEYGEGEWKRVESDAASKLGGLDEELARLASEINRLGDVLALISPRAAPATHEPVGERSLELLRDETPRAPAHSAPPAPAPAQPVEAPEAPRFVARGGRGPGRESGPARTIHFPPQRESPPARETPAAREPAPSALDELTFLKSMTLDPRPSSPTAAAPAPAVVEGKTERSQAVPKTLKCGECGALNRPTEWYCERCGAELAAV
jgi:hypothetical protein